MPAEKRAEHYQRIGPASICGRGWRSPWAPCLGHEDGTIRLRFSKTGLTVGAERRSTSRCPCAHGLRLFRRTSHLRAPVSAPEAMQELFPPYFPIWVLEPADAPSGAREDKPERRSR